MQPRGYTLWTARAAPAAIARPVEWPVAVSRGSAAASPASHAWSGSGPMPWAASSSSVADRAVVRRRRSSPTSARSHASLSGHGPAATTTATPATRSSPSGVRPPPRPMSRAPAAAAAAGSRVLTAAASATTSSRAPATISSSPSGAPTTSPAVPTTSSGAPTSSPRGHGTRGSQTPSAWATTSSRAARAPAAPRSQPGQRPHRLGERLHRRLDDPGADLADARLAVRDAGVDERQHARAHDLAAVDPERRPAEAERRDLVAAALPPRDVVHGAGGLQRVVGPAADDAHDRRGRGHREAAEPDRLRDRAVADVGVGVLGPEPREVEPVDHPGRAGEPALAGAAQADSELGPVAGHGDDDRGALDTGRGVGAGLRGRHREVEVEVVVAGDEARDRRLVGLGLAELDQRGQQRAQEQRRGGAVAVVALVAHLERLRGDRAQVDGLAQPPQRAGEHAREHVADPGQAVEHLGVVGP